MGGLLKYSVKTYDFGELIIIGNCLEILIRKKLWQVGEEIIIPRNLDGMKLNKGGLLMIQDLSATYDIGIYTLGTIEPLIELRYVALDSTLSTPNKINIKTNDYDNVLTLKNNLSLLNLSARIILLNE